MLDKDRIRFYYSLKVNITIFLAKQLRPTKNVSYAIVSLPLKNWDKAKSARLSLPLQHFEESHASLQETPIPVYKTQGEKRPLK